LLDRHTEELRLDLELEYRLCLKFEEAEAEYLSSEAVISRISEACPNDYYEMLEALKSTLYLITAAHERELGRPLTDRGYRDVPKWFF